MSDESAPGLDVVERGGKKYIRVLEDGQPGFRELNEQTIALLNDSLSGVVPESAHAAKVRQFADDAGITGRVKAGAKEALSTTTLSGSDWVGEALLGEEYTEQRRLEREALPGTMTVANVAAMVPMVAATVASGGTAAAGGALARAGAAAAKTPLGRLALGAEAAGNALARGVAPYVGAGRFGAAATGAVRVGTQAALETGALAGVQAAQELALSEQQWTPAEAAEKFVTAAGTGGAMGFALGSPLGAMGGMLTRALKPKIPKGVPDEIAGVSTREASYDTLQVSLKSEAKAGAAAIARSVDDAPAPVRAGLDELPAVRKKASRVALEKLQATERQMKKIRGREEAVGDRVVKMGLVREGDDFVTMHQAATTKVDELGAQLGDDVTVLDETGILVGQKELLKSTRELRDRLLKPGALGAQKRVAQRITDEVITPLEEMAKPNRGRLTFGQVVQQRRDLDRLVMKFDQTTTNAERELLQDARWTLEDSFLKIADRAAASSKGKDPAWLARYRQNKADYSAAKWAEEALEYRARKQMSGRRTLPEMLGDLVTGGVANPIAAARMAFGDGAEAISNISADLTIQLAREGKSNVIGLVSDRLAQVTDGKVAQAVRKALRPTGRAIGVAGEAVIARDAANYADKILARREGEPLGKAYDRALARVEGIVREDPERRQATPLDLHAPETAREIRKMRQRAAAHMLRTAPSQPRPPGALGRAMPEPTEHAIRSWARRMDYLKEGPSGLLKALERGSLSMDRVEAVRDVFPLEYERFKRITLTELQTNPKDLEYDKRVQLSLMLGVPLDPSMRPDSIRRVQRLWQGREPRGMMPRERTKTAPVGGTLSQSQQLEQQAEI